MKVFEKQELVILAVGVAAVLAVLLWPSSAGAAQAQDRSDLVVAHQNTAFPLIGKHLQLACGSCHINGVVAGTPIECESCHWSRRQDDPFQLQLGSECGECHTPLDWARIQPGSWDHEQRTGFRLDGMHRTLSCVECHDSQGFSGATAECAQCHQADFQSAQAPNHVAASFPTDCELCHFNAASWVGARFDHAFFPLSGQHSTVPCESCHQNGRFAGTPTECFACHRADFERTRNPNHVEAGFSTDCVVCHSATAANWIGAQFDHDLVFPLTGSHKVVDCEQCHQNGVFTGTPSACVDCHRADYDRTQSPNHAQAGFPTNCAGCHGASATTWQNASFDHDAVFRLSGMHQTADCTECHVSGRFAGTPSECLDCHRAEYDQTSSPNHQQAGFSTNCVSCHGDSATSWLGAQFQHDRVFRLSGRHRAIDCEQCHVNGRFAGTPSDCIACHRADYDRTTNPNHGQSGFGTDCVACHGDSATTWTGADFDHNAFFPLVGRHRNADCTQCHVGGQFAGTSSDCVSCHRADYDATRSPNHAASGFGTNCESCHGAGATTWTNANFNHDSFFQLLGRHKTADCTQCHVNGQFAGTPSDCVSCHRADYDATQSPRHAAAGFGTNCASCHGNAATTWLGANFDHNSVFALEGAHRQLDCNQCHAQGYNLPQDCFGCHASDYNQARSPNHANAGFPTSCENCHFPSHTRWSQGAFNHDFPITNGAHKNLDCTECHKTSSYFQFACIDCHEHRQSKMNEKHNEVGGYSYNSQACYSCHPDGRS